MKRQTYAVKNRPHTRIAPPFRAKKKTDRPEPSPPRRMGPYPPVGGAWLNGRSGDGGWELVICGDLTDKQFDLLDRLASVPRGSRGTIWFDSCGGSAYVGLSLASMIRLRGLDATAVVAGECSSAAIMPFAACARRFVTRHATLLFHPVRWHSEENVRMEEAAEWARHFQVMERDLDELLTKMLPMDGDALAVWTRPGKFVSGEELVEAGVAKLIDLFGGDVWTQIRTAEQTTASA